VAGRSHRRAARILGARDVVVESTGAAVVDKSVHDLREQLKRQARARFGPQQWARAYAAGRTISLDPLMRDIDTRLVRSWWRRVLEKPRCRRS
jgi:hypothetical protein